MSPAHPYTGLPDHRLWRRATSATDPRDFDPVVRGGFTLTPETKITTAGSCFAQHIADRLKRAGYRYLVTEKPHPILSAPVARRFGYGVYTARYGNLYTPRQLLQLLRRSVGRLQPAEDVWERADGRLIDPFRPDIQPDGFATRAEFDAAREAQFWAVRGMIRQSDVFVFTFGLTEAWVSREDGMVFPVAPGVAGGQFDPDRHRLTNFTVDQIVDDFSRAVAFMRKRNPDLKVLTTVSPVPLIATARSDQSVIAASAYSKSVLRVACEELCRTLPDCHYFPSYEIVTSAWARGAYWQDDLRNVAPEAVDHVMALFMKHYTQGPVVRAGRAGKGGDADVRALEAALDLACEEELIAAAVDDGRAQ